MKKNGIYSGTPLDELECSHGTDMDIWRNERG